MEIRITSVISKDLINSVDEIVNIASMLNVDIRLQHIMWHSEETKIKNKFVLKQEFNYDDNIIDGFLSKCPIDVNEIKEIIRTFKYKTKERNVDLQIYPNLTDVELCVSGIQINQTSIYRIKKSSVIIVQLRLGYVPMVKYHCVNILIKK